MTRWIVVVSLLYAVPIDAQVLERVVAPSTALTNWEVLGQATYKTRKLIVGDFDGDNLDDLFWDEQGPSSYRIGILRAKGDGTFSALWTTNGSPFIGPSANNQILSGGTYLTGKFLGGTQALLLQIDNGWYHVYAFRSNSVYPLSGVRYVIGKARLESGGVPTRFVTGRFSPGANVDLLLSFELLPSGGQMARLQRYGPNDDNFNELWNNSGTPAFFGGWYFNYGADEFFAADFVPGNGTDELLCINRTNGWLKIMRFDGAKWGDLYANYGTYQVYATPVGNATKFGVGTRVLAGNFDTTDGNAELILFSPSQQLELASFEFDPRSLTFRPERKPTRDIAGLERKTLSSQPVRAYERWATPRICTTRFLGICFRYSGGQQIQQARDFYPGSEQVGNLQVVAGNFYNNGWAAPWSRDILVLRDATLHSPALEPSSAFYTSCDNTHMFSGQCGSTITLYNVLGQVINRYDVPTGWFEKAVAPGQLSALYSAQANSDL